MNIMTNQENKAYFVCPEYGKRHFIFGDSHAEEVVSPAGAPLLAQLPIDPQIAALCDAGKIEDGNISDISECLKSFLMTIPEFTEKKNG